MAYRKKFRGGRSGRKFKVRGRRRFGARRGRRGHSGRGVNRFMLVGNRM